MTTLAVDRPPTKTHYPDSDGKPMAESDFQRKPLAYAVEALAYFFRDRPDVYVSGNLLIYYEEGSPELSVAPDVFVVVGVPRQERRSYFIWREGKAPDFVIEITSRATRSEDQGAKRGIYAYLGVREYFQYDPTGDYLRPPLQGDRLSEGRFLPVAPSVLPDGNLSLTSQVLNIELRLEGSQLRLYDLKTGEKLLTYEEAQDARREARAEAERLRAELARLKGEPSNNP
jgi:Uma2 family endonuclease